MAAMQNVIKIKPMHIPNTPALTFPTIITQFEDTWTPNWRSEMVYARMDPLGFYGGTTRTLTLGFRVIGEDPYEAQNNMAQLEKLIQYQYPTFQRHGAMATLKAPPYFSVEVMNLARTSGGSRNKGTQGLQGYFTSPLTINPGFQDKTNPQYFSSDFKKIYFSDVNVTFQMVVLHSHEVGFYNQNTTYGVGAGQETYPYGVSPSADGPSNAAAGKAAGYGPNIPHATNTAVQGVTQVVAKGLNVANAQGRIARNRANLSAQQRRIMRRRYNP
jgi:hypothetical protein